MPLSQIWVLLVLVLSVLPEQGNTCCFLAVQRPKIHKVSLTQYSLSKRDARISNNVIYVGLLSEKQCVRSVSSSCTKRRRSSAFHTHGPGDGCALQLLHTRCLIVPFAYLAALFHFPCCWCWENTHTTIQLWGSCPPSLFLSSQHPPAFSFFPCFDSAVAHSLSISLKLGLRKKNCKLIHRAVTMSMGTLFFFPEHT